MGTITLNLSDDKFIISIDKNSINKDALLQFLENLRLEALASKVDFGEDIEELGEEITSEWWRSNKDRLIPQSEQWKKVIVDSNIIFSALRGKNSQTRNKILNSQDVYFAPNFLIGEIFKHKERILDKSKASEDETLEFLLKILSKIHFISEDSIPTESFIAAYRLCKNIDEKDTPFIALSFELGYELWTRDNELKINLLKKGFDNFYKE